MRGDPRPSSSPVVAVTMGDPAGVGPEVVVKAIHDGGWVGLCRPVVVGGAEVMREACQRFGPLQLRAIRIDEMPDHFERGKLYLIEAFGSDMKTVIPGSHSKATGRAAGAAVRLAAKLAFDGKVAAMTTAPISKDAFFDLGLGFGGHTEFLEGLCEVPRSMPMFLSTRLRVTLATSHVPLAQVVTQLSKERILDAICYTHLGMCRFFGRKRPRIAIAGLNPHCGEYGHMGVEEGEVIRPAIEAATKLGIDACGPYSADSLFERAAEDEEFDAIVAMYHDQGLAPLRALGRRRVVNLSLGIPFIRTSVEHGTAPDIAWKGVANHESMARALATAGRLASRVGTGRLDWTMRGP